MTGQAAQKQNPLQQALDHQRAGRLQEAESIYKAVLQQVPNQPDALHLYGLLLSQHGQAERGIPMIRKAAEAQPNNAMLFNNLGVSLQQNGRVEEAAEAYERSVAIAPQHGAGWYNLGNTYQKLQRWPDAIRAYEHALTHLPQDPDLHNNLGRVFLITGQNLKALACFRQAVALDPDYSNGWVNMATTLHNLRFDAWKDDIHRDLLHCFDRKEVDVQDLAAPALSLLAHSPALAPLFTGQPIQDPQALSAPLFLALLQHCILPNRHLEAAITAVRSAYLAQPDPAVERFIAALAQQCFLNDYVYAQTQQETEQADLLESSLSNSVPANTSDDLLAVQVAILACYRPLWQTSICDAVYARIQSRSALAPLLRQQVTNPRKEQEIRKQLQTDDLANRVSQEVAQQYEEHPYPHWTRIANRPPEAMRAVILRLFPHLRGTLQTIPPEPRILIAGCGTGRHAITTARRFKGSQVRAIDLSTASLAYASRMAEELGVDNVTFEQCDILNFSDDTLYDLIESVGVLHHMETPMDGWRNLVHYLAPRGLMKIGLYSHLARPHIREVREWSTLLGFSSSAEDIRKARQTLLSMPEDDPKYRATTGKEFYALAHCRDLLFHAQEHQFTLPQITECLDELGLEFLGFEIRDARVMPAYHAMFPDDPNATSLENWHRFEEERPRSFAGMYQFWVRKK